MTLKLFLLPLITVLSKTHLETVLEDYIITPFGYWDKNCVYGVPAGSHIDNYDDHFTVSNEGIYLEKIYRCKTFHNSKKINQRIKQAKILDGLINDNNTAVDGDGWQEYTKMNSGDTTSALLGNWNVPALPTTKAGQILYMFTGLQNIDWVPPEKEPDQAFDIIQPVMTFGHSPATSGSGEYWSCASWYVTLGRDVVYSQPFGEIEPGTNIFGNMTKTGTDSWYINCVDTKSNKNTPLTISRSILTTQPWIYVTLEVYNTFNCNEYPPSGTKVSFTNLTLYENGIKKSINWEVGKNGQQPPICDSSVSVDSSTQVTITF